MSRPQYPDGFVKVPREMLQDPFFKETREFSRREAWLDLMGTRARGIPDEKKKIPRGHLEASYNELAEAWGWTRKRTITFIQNLLDMKWLQLVRAGDYRTGSPALYCVVDFERYNGTATVTAEGTAKPAPVAENTRVAAQVPLQPRAHLKEERTDLESGERTLPEKISDSEGIPARTKPASRAVTAETRDRVWAAIAQELRRSCPGDYIGKMSLSDLSHKIVVRFNGWLSDESRVELRAALQKAAEASNHSRGRIVHLVVHEAVQVPAHAPG